MFNVLMRFLADFVIYYHTQELCFIDSFYIVLSVLDYDIGTLQLPDTEIFVLFTFKRLLGFV